MYLCAKPPLLDLWDVGVCCCQSVKIHFVELVVELFSKLPRQVIMAGGGGKKNKKLFLKICIIYCDLTAESQADCFAGQSLDIS